MSPLRGVILRGVILNDLNDLNQTFKTCFKTCEEVYPAEEVYPDIKAQFQFTPPPPPQRLRARFARFDCDLRYLHGDLHGDKASQASTYKAHDL
ncbi:hypothetical protein AB6D20_027835 (plasmid) [Vibrio splendidus]